MGLTFSAETRPRCPASCLLEEYRRRPWEGQLKHWASVAADETALACVDAEVLQLT